MKFEKWSPARMWFSNIPDDKLWINLAWPVTYKSKVIYESTYGCLWKHGYHGYPILLKMSMSIIRTI